ncbi:fatty acyl-CoA reductase 1-like [Styela clava]|uniref:fatty acyl-CoA reductase 1-like n=1 Tax=Styela clava TaxID=7725 RepID=UPI00193ABDEB|nr:fatty acyl-CoA reductase 1-like [Styela clava]
MSVMDNQSIQEYYAGKTLALTGGTGFVGQCLVEKLLRSCPNIKKIFLLVRPRKGVSGEERIQKFVSEELFDKLREINPDFQTKLHAINCDLEKENLGISDESMQILIDEVQIFYHSAATLRFNEHLRLAFLLNTLAVKRLISICKKMKHLECLVHLSTAYSHCDRTEIGEKHYDTNPKFEDIENAVSWMDDDMITKLTPEIIGKRPNTYTLTKAIGEEIIFRESCDLPVVILRPSIIGAIWNDPIPGWITTLNGPTGVIVAYGKGILQTMRIQENLVLDIIPVDFTVNCAIAAGWKRGTEFLQKKSSTGLTMQIDDVKPDPAGDGNNLRTDIPIYNLTSGTYNPNVITEWHKSMLYWFESYPFNGAFRKPVFTLTTSDYTQRFLMFFYHYVPAYFFDIALRVCGRKPRLTRLTQKVDSALDVLQYFLNHTFKWDNDNTMALLQNMSPEDKETFNFDPRCIDWHEYMKHFTMGTRKHILKDDPESYPAARRHLRMLRILSYFFHSITFLLLWRLLIAPSGIAQNVWHLVVSLCFKFLRFFQISSTLHKGSLFSSSLS